MGQVAQAFPTVHQFVVMNECNQPLFVNPQFDTSGANQSAAICGRALAAGYDALKAVSTRNFVWGVGLSPRGNDLPNAASNVSTSPVKFLQALGAWFKASGRSKPIMDGLDFHPYPIPQSLPFASGYPQVVDASVSNLPRIYQAFYDGFNGSAQPTIGQQAGGGLPLSLNEVGIQTDSTGKPGYVGTETAANAAGGVLGATATEAYQASWYLQMLQLVACDPNVKLVNIYHLIDEASLAGWQSGPYYVDRTAKQSAAAVHDWIASTGGVCVGAVRPWTPPGVPAKPTTPAPATPPSAGRTVVTSGGRVRVFDAVTHVLRRVIAPFGSASRCDADRGRRRQPRLRRRLRGRRKQCGEDPQRQVGRRTRDVLGRGGVRRARRRERRQAGGSRRRDEEPGEGLRREDARAARDAVALRGVLRRCDRGCR